MRAALLPVLLGVVLPPHWMQEDAALEHELPHKSHSVIDSWHIDHARLRHCYTLMLDGPGSRQAAKALRARGAHEAGYTLVASGLGWFHVGSEDMYIFCFDRGKFDAARVKQAAAHIEILDGYRTLFDRLGSPLRAELVQVDDSPPSATMSFSAPGLDPAALGASLQKDGFHGDAASGWTRGDRTTRALVEPDVDENGDPIVVLTVISSPPP